MKISTLKKRLKNDIEFRKLAKCLIEEIELEEELEQYNKDNK